MSQNARRNGRVNLLVGTQADERRVGEEVGERRLEQSCAVYH
jgi:hypothetical protein